MHTAGHTTVLHTVAATCMAKCQTVAATCVAKFHTVPATSHICFSFTKIAVNTDMLHTVAATCMANCRTIAAHLLQIFKVQHAYRCRETADLPPVRVHLPHLSSCRFSGQCQLLFKADVLTHHNGSHVQTLYFKTTFFTNRFTQVLYMLLLSYTALLHSCENRSRWLLT